MILRNLDGFGFSNLGDPALVYNDRVVRKYFARLGIKNTDVHDGHRRGLLLGKSQCLLKIIFIFDGILEPLQFWYEELIAKLDDGHSPDGGKVFLFWCNPHIKRRAA